MKKNLLFALPILGLLLLTGALLWHHARQAQAAPTVLVGPLEGGCYQVTALTCKLYVEPFTIEIAPAEALTAFYLDANGHVIYDYATTSGHAPVGSYTPSGVKKDFAAVCGQTYTLELHALDTGDLDFVTIGQTAAFTCPKPDYRIYLPIVR